jgi:hypothetical protein
MLAEARAGRMLTAVKPEILLGKLVWLRSHALGRIGLQTRSALCYLGVSLRRRAGNATPAIGRSLLRLRVLGRGSWGWSREGRAGGSGAAAAHRLSAELGSSLAALVYAQQSPG